MTFLVAGFFLMMTFFVFLTIFGCGCSDDDETGLTGRGAGLSCFGLTTFFVL
jgi:hypothetical protein